MEQKGLEEATKIVQKYARALQLSLDTQKLQHFIGDKREVDLLKTALINMSINVKQEDLRGKRGK